MSKKKKETGSTNVAVRMDLDTDTDLLRAKTGAGISKKPGKQPRGKGRRAQRLRKEQSVEKALEIIGRTEKKVQKSAGKGKTVKERSVCASIQSSD